MRKPQTVLLSGLLLTLAPVLALAEGLPRFTGYTRPGNPSGASRPVAEGKTQDPFGATVYFRVYEQTAEGVDTDPWGTSIPSLTNSFVGGEASRGKNTEQLDTRARYLYLYQVVNDSRRKGEIRSAAIRLLVEPYLITSWGYLASDREKDRYTRGAGFSMPFDEEKGGKAWPFSTNHAGVTDRTYRNPATYFEAPRQYGISPVQLGNAAKADSLEAEEPGRAPQRVVLHSSYDFRGAPSWLVKDRARLVRTFPTWLQLHIPALDRYEPGETTGPGAAAAFPNAAALAQGDHLFGLDMHALDAYLRRAPAVVAVWSSPALKPGERSTIFGFTSNYPPVYENVRLRTSSPPADGPVAPAAEGQARGPAADGEVPTPVSLEQPLPPAAAAPTPIASLGVPASIGAGGGFIRGGVGGFGGGFGGFGGFGGGGFGGFGNGLLGAAGGGMGGGSGGGGSGTSSNSSTGNSSGGTSSGTSSSGNNQGQSTPSIIFAPVLNNGTNGNNNSATGGSSTNGNNSATGGANTVTITITNSPQQNVTVSQSNNNSNTQSNNQSVSQAQHQAQSQSQWQHGGSGGPGKGHGDPGGGGSAHVVPEPAAFIPFLLGLPAALTWSLRRRRKGNEAH